MAQAKAKTTASTSAAKRAAKSPAKKPTRKTAARKPGPARKTSAKAAFSAPRARLETVSGSVKEVVYAQLGLIGRFYDNVSDIRGSIDGRLQDARKNAPKQWKKLVTRGEQVERDLRDSQSELKKQVKRIDLQDGVEKVRETVTKVRDRLRNAA